MKTGLTAALLAAFISAAPCFAAQLPAPPTIRNEHGTVVATVKGAVRWTANWTMEPWMVAGKNAVRFTETGSGHYSPFTQGVRWTLESIWLADGTFYPLQFDKTIRDTQGRTLAVEKKTFDRKAGIAKFERRDEKDHIDSSTYDAPADILAIEGIAGILQNFHFAKSGPDGSLSAHLLSNEPKLYNISIEPRGIERLKTPNGEIDCYKIELVPHLGLLNIFRVFFPKTYFWFSVAAPHTWVRYQGLESGAGTPEIIMESR